MNSLSQLFSHYCIIPFAITFLIPKGSAQAAVAAAAAPLAIWASFADGSHASLIITLLVFAGGLLSGMLARTTLAALPGRRKTAFTVAVACSVGLVLLPGSLAAEFGHLAHSANLTLRHWETRAPSGSCFASRYPVSIAGATYRVPAAPILTIAAQHNAYHFQFNTNVRSICERTQGASAPIHAENLNLDFGIPMRGPFCETAKSGWGLELCSHEALSPPSVYPAIANIYSPAEYDRSHIINTHSYSDFLKSRDKAIAAGHPLEVAQAGVFERYANGYWVARRGIWANDAGEPFTLHCGDAVQAGVLRCSTSYLLKSGPRVTYHFNAPGNRLEDVARQVDRNLHVMLAEFSAS